MARAQLEKVNIQLEFYQGRVWHTGTKSSQRLKDLPMGRNMVARVPHELATRLGLPDPDLYTFHSFKGPLPPLQLMAVVALRK
jgi:hypothetical protein